MKLFLALCLSLTGILPLRADSDTIAVPRAQLEQIHRDFQDARARLEIEDKQLGEVQGALATAFQTTIPNLQLEVQALANGKAEAEAQVTIQKAIVVGKEAIIASKDTTIASKNRVIFWLSVPLAVLCGLVTFMLWAKLGLNMIFSPYGYIIGGLLPAAVAGVVMLLLRFI